MDAATERDRANGISAFLSGLQAGMLGVCWMLAWLGISAVWQRRSFWTAGNLMASAFYGGSAIRGGFGVVTLSGLALHLFLYSLLGAVFAFAIRDRVSPARILLLGVLFGLAWYFISYRILWKTAMPLVALLHLERPTILGHLIYGTFVGRFPAYLPGPMAVEQTADSGGGTGTEMDANGAGT